MFWIPERIFRACWDPCNYDWMELLRVREDPQNRIACDCWNNLNLIDEALERLEIWAVVGIRLN